MATNGIVTELQRKTLRALRDGATLAFEWNGYQLYKDGQVEKLRTRHGASLINRGWVGAHDLRLTAEGRAQVPYERMAAAA